MLGFGLALAVLIANALASYQNIWGLVDKNRWVVHTREVMNQVNRVVLMIREAESGQRAFLLSGDEVDLAGFEGNVAEIRGGIAILGDLTSDNLLQRRQVPALGQKVEERLALLRETIAKRRKEGLEAAARDIASGRGRRSMAEVTELASAIMTEEASLLDRRTADSSAGTGRSVATFTIATVVAIVTIILCFLLARRYIRERERSEEGLREGEERVRLLLESTGEGLFGVDPEGRCTFANPSAARLLGRADAPSLLGRTLPEIVAGPAAEGTAPGDAAARLGRALAFGLGAHDDNATFRREDGSLVPVEYWSHPIARDGRKLGSVVTFVDTTARKRSEQTMRLRERALRAISQGIFITDPGQLEEPIIYVNAAFERLTGYLAGEASGRDIRFLRGFDTDPVAVETIQAAFRDGKECSVELLAYRKDGSTFWCALSLSPVEDVSGRVTHFVGVMTDVTERKVAEVELQRAKESAEAASRSKSTFLANMSHELRTPLNAIIGYGEMLQEEAEDSGRDDFAADLQKIHGAGKHLLGLINDILDLSKIEAGKMDLYLETFEVSDLIRGVVETISPLIEKNGNVLKVDCPDGLGTMHGDLTKTRQALFNLLSNASKFTRDGTIGLDVSREPSDQGDWLVYRVVDSGIGMSSDQLARLFQPFTQADASTTRKYGGTGLGLTITRRFCQMLGGDVSVQSESEKGSTFTIRLPAEAPEHRGDQNVPNPSPVGLTGVTTGSLILVVDDDPTVCDLIRRTLEKDGYRVAWAHTGKEGLEMARLMRPDAITLDVMMPGMDGWAVLTALKSDPSLAEIPVVMVTMVDEKRIGYSLGASDYLTKPIDRARLASILEKYRRTATGGTILLIEDDLDTREMVRQMLEGDGWTIVEAENGRAGLDRLAEAKPDLILLDLMMPELDGFGFAAEARRHPEWRDVPILVMTAMDLTAEDRLRLNGQVLGILQKGSYSREALLREIRREIQTHLGRKTTTATPSA